MNFFTNIFRMFTCSQIQNTVSLAEVASPTQNIPDEILQLIFSKVSLPDQANISRVCKRWHSVNNDDLLWKDLYYQIFNSKEQQLENFNQFRSYKAECERKLKAMKRNVEYDFDEINKESEEGQRILVSLATRIGRIDPDSLATDILLFHIKREEARIELAKLVGKSLPLILAEEIKFFDIESEKARIELATKLVCDRNPLFLAESIDDFNSEFDKSRYTYTRSIKCCPDAPLSFQVDNKEAKNLWRFIKNCDKKIGKIINKSRNIIVIPEMQLNKTMLYNIFQSRRFDGFLSPIYAFCVSDHLALYKISKLIVRQYMNAKMQKYQNLTASKQKIVFDKFLTIILMCFALRNTELNSKLAYKLATYIPCDKTKSKVMSGVVKSSIDYSNCHLGEKAAKLISEEPTRSLALQQVVNVYAIHRNYQEAFELCNEIHDSEIKLHLLENITKAFFIFNNEIPDIEEAKKFMGLLATACQEEEIIRSIINILFSVSHFSHEVKKELALRFGATLATGELSGIALQAIKTVK